MTILFGVFIVFVALAGALAVGHASSTGYLERIRVQRARRNQLQARYRALREEVAELRKRETFLARKVEGLREGNTVPEEQKTSRRAACCPTETVVDVLLREKLLAPENLAKAERYRQQTNSPHTIDEILSLLGYVSGDVIQRIKRRYPHLC